MGGDAFRSSAALFVDAGQRVFGAIDRCVVAVFDWEQQFETDLSSNVWLD